MNITGPRVFVCCNVLDFLIMVVLHTGTLLQTVSACLSKLGLTCNYCFITFHVFVGKVPKCGLVQETDRQGRYRRTNTSGFAVFATRIQWKTCRTRIRPKFKENEFNFILLTRATPGFVDNCFIDLLVNVVAQRHLLYQSQDIFFPNVANSVQH